ncbi:MAG: hypothetical protein HY852_26600 [Bradyrhizobium sp.]|uniref:hypothetical protein n=1 Tax=Bradyrhizobium sp. TaxID=376 RepID=UPI0025BFBFEE|nr:hypothetical protein [Bradyrhizobium sp.]MBI5265379.1 hypothetical protein [Bradyrhizobium sp.]
MTSSVLPSRRLGTIGSIVGLLALVAAVLPHWVLPVMFPPPPVDQVIVDTGHRVKERLVARAKGVEYQAPRPEKSLGHRWSDGLSIAALSLGLLAITLAVVSRIFHEEKLLAGVSAVLGVGAIAFEFSFILIGALILIAIIYAVLQFIDLF